jgi:putative flippase GtrA
MIDPATNGLPRSRRDRAQKVFWQFARFLGVGVVSFAVDYGLFFVLFHLLGVQYVVASTISFSLSLVLNYFLSLKFVFQAQPGRNVAKEFAIYIGLNAVALGLNQAILFMTVDWLGTNPLVGKLIATAVVLVYNFISRKLLIEGATGGRSTVTPDDGTGPLVAGSSK